MSGGTSHPPPPQPNAIPPVDFNLFRSNSVYSIDSLLSLESNITEPGGSLEVSELEKIFREAQIQDHNNQDHYNGAQGYGHGHGQQSGRRGDTTPTTPRAIRSHPGQAGYFDVEGINTGSSSAAVAAQYHLEQLESGQTTPTKARFQPGSSQAAPAPSSGFVVKSRPIPPPVPIALSLPTNRRTPLIPAPISAPLNTGQPTSFQLQNNNPYPSLASGSSSSSFQRAPNGLPHLSEPKDSIHPVQDIVFARVSGDNADLASIHGEQGSEWGEDEEQFEWLDTDRAPEAVNGIENKNTTTSPSKLAAKIRAKVPSIRGRPPSVGGKRLKKGVVFPTRAAPPPPTPNTGSSGTFDSGPSTAVPLSARTIREDDYSSEPSTTRPQTSASQQQRSHIPPPRSQQSYGDNHLPIPSTSSSFAPGTSPSPNFLSPTMVALKDESAGNSGMKSQRASGLSLQSNAYSFYDLEPGSPGPGTPRATTPGGGELLFPKGKYTKVSTSKIDQAVELREREHGNPNYNNNYSYPSPRPPFTERSFTANSQGSNDGGLSPEDFVRKGLDARGNGDLPKSAWYFMKAAEGGNVTGRMYWGLALRHGWGIAKDEKKAFVELRSACDDGMQEGGLDFHKSPMAAKLTAQQKKVMNKDLSMGLFEIANCFLDGAGVKKAPEVGVSYLRFAANLGDVASQEQLGFVLSKGAGVKKDMKEAAKWYRMAIAQGSGNTFGLAWIWKDKYMD